MTAEQLEASRSERMRQNGHGAITFEDARTWIEETGLCLFLPRRQFASSVAPSFVEAVAGQRNATPDPKQIAHAEELLVRLEQDGVVVRLNLHGQPGEQPDFVVAAWVLPYVYALRGDRDWRRSPQLTGSRQVSPLAVQAYKLLEAAETNVTALTHALGREVTETAVIRAITELWQQLRIIPVISYPGDPAKWQLLRVRFQKAIAEGASTSQVTAISVLASIYLQAVIAATMEDVEVFLSSLTARSKVREVLRGLVATRQVHTIALGHAPHFYVAGTLPEFSVTPSFYTSSSMSSSSSYFLHAGGREVEPEAPVVEDVVLSEPVFAAAESAEVEEAEVSETGIKVEEKAAETIVAAPAPKPAAARPAPSHDKPAERPRFSRPASHSREHKPAATGSRPARRSDDSRSSARPAAARGTSSHGSASRPASAHAASSRPSSSRPSSGSARPSSGTARPAGSRPSSSRPGSARPASGRPAAARPAGSRPAGPRPAGSRPAAAHARPTASNRWAAGPAKSSNGNGKPASSHGSAAARGSNGTGKPAARSAKPAVGARGAQGPAKPQRSGARPVAKSSAAPAHKSTAVRGTAAPRGGSAVRGGARQPAGAAKSTTGKRFSYSNTTAKKRG